MKFLYSFVAEQLLHAKTVLCRFREYYNTFCCKRYSSYSREWLQASAHVKKIKHMAAYGVPVHELETIQHENTCVYIIQINI